MSESKTLDENVRDVQQAAERGNVKAQFNLGVMYEDGCGVEQDLTKAKMWLNKACDNGYQQACEILRKM